MFIRDYGFGGWKLEEVMAVFSVLRQIGSCVKNSQSTLKQNILCSVFKSAVLVVYEFDLG
jgi:hypothetical protein